MSTLNLHKTLKIDLHSHTKFSDGHLTPTELVLRAHTMQVDVLAITDHDTIAGLDEAHATQAQQKRQLTLIDGVEISRFVRYRNKFTARVPYRTSLLAPIV